MTVSPLWKPRSGEDRTLDEEVWSRAGVGSAPPELIRRLLSIRGYAEPESIGRLLSPQVKDLKDPRVLLNMDKAVARLLEAYRRSEKICIYADFDLDGTSGLALLYYGLKALGFRDLVRYQPKRLSEGYGFHREAVEDLHQQGVRLIVTVDVGITSNAAVERAQELGIDVVLTDHHLPGEVLPPAHAVVNPNQPADSSGLGYLCGAGVAFYFLRALKRGFYEDPALPKNELDFRSVLEFFTIATLTDMVPLVEDNRALVKQGLAVLSETRKAGLRALLDELDLSGRPLTSQDVAIRFAPKLNALSRMEAGVLPIDIFLCEDPVEARRLIGFVLENNSTRVQLQSDAENHALELLTEWPHADFLFVYSERFHRGVVGLIATKLAQSMNRPAFVGSLDPQEGTIVGSARLPSGHEICLVEALGSASAVLHRYGGHSAAAGFELLLGSAAKFASSLEAHFLNLKRSPKPMEIEYDLEAKLEEIGTPLMKWYDFIGPFGAGFSIPLFRFSGVELLGIRELRGGHRRLQLASSQGERWEALLFSPTTRQLQILDNKPASLDLLGELQWNYFGGQKQIQILVKDLKGSSWQ